MGFKSQLLVASATLLFPLFSNGLVITPGKPTVTIASGVLVGTTTAVPGATATVNQFLGIPFAASPPVRFNPPTSPSKWSAPLDVSAFKPVCIQQFNDPPQAQAFTELVFNNHGGLPPAESEDCLYANVFAPSTPGPSVGRTVMVWIFGGALQFGGGGISSYDGSSFAANQDVIIVTFNYRTNVFGFSNSPEIPLTSRNAGFLDQRFALQWVQQNIAAFGGNPHLVTVFGESAGALSIDELLTTIPSNPPFRAAILESGTSLLADIFPTTGPTGLSAWTSLVTALNCSNTANTLACVRAAPATTIQNIIEEGEYGFPPVYDGVTRINDPAQVRKSGKFARVPVLMGTNSQEGRVFDFGMTNETAYVDSTFPPALQQPIINAYPYGPLDTPYDIISEITTDFLFNCPQGIVANETSAAGVPTWRYLFNASFPNTQAVPGLGVYHSSEIPIVFGNYPIAGATPQEIGLSKFMQTTWANFAKNPFAGPGWAPVNPAGGKYLAVLGNNGGTGAQLISPAVNDEKCPLYTGIYNSFGGV